MVEIPTTVKNKELVERRRKQIVLAGIKLFSRNGFHKTTLKELAEEAGRGTLLVAIAGWRQWVLGAWKISAERADIILLYLRKVIGRFGSPCAAMRDLGRAMIPALDELVSGLQQPIPVLACHQHFLADVGKDLLNPSHAQLRFRQWKVRPNLRALVRELGRSIDQDIDAAREAACRWQNLSEDGHRIESGLAGLAETEQGLGQMRKQLDTWVASLHLRRPARGPAQDMREAIDLILKHIETHGDNLWGHAIGLPQNKGVRLVARTNMIAENFFGTVKHEERRRSGRKNLGQDLENLPAEALLVQNLKHDDYIDTLCGSLRNLARAFAEMDEDDRNKENKGAEDKKQKNDLRSTLQIESAFLSTADRRIIRNAEMNRRVAAAAKSRAPKIMC